MRKVLNMLFVTFTFLIGQPLSAQVWNQEGMDIDGEAVGDHSANSVSLNADATVLAIGADLNSGTAGANSEMGHVRVYEWNGTAWVQRGADIDGEAAGDHAGISVDLSEDGNTLVVGAFGNDQTAINAGHVRIFVWNGTSWQQKGASINGESAFDHFGTSVNLSADGNIVAIGAPANGGNGSTSGHVRIYEWNGTSWIQLGADIDGEASGDESGNAIDLSADGTVVAIGAHSNDGNGTDSGHTRVYQWSGTTWIQKGSDIDGEAAFDFSGKSVSLSANGNILAIGADQNDGASGNLAIGHVRIYEWNGTSWNQLGMDIDGEAAGDQSGFSVSLNSLGNTVAIGAFKNDGNGSNSGHTRVYEWNGSTWLQKGFDIDGEQSDNYSGYAVSLGADGNSLAIGAPRNDGNGTYSGHARVYRSCTPTTGTDVITACDSYNWIDGNTYTASNNTATHTLTNTAGCDSVVTLNLTIKNSSMGTDVITACDSYNWIDGNTYTASNNTATHTLTNAAGCDSVVTLNLIIKNSSTGTDVITACDSYNWIDGNTYTASNNTATHTLTNAAGCDSVITLNLTIKNSSTGTDVITACESYNWIDGNTYTASNNTATHTLTNAVGCDSVVTINLTINTVDVSVTSMDPNLMANATDATYQWLDCDENFAPISGETNANFSPNENGNYAVEVTQNGCVDTSACEAILTVVLNEMNYSTTKVYPNPTNEQFMIDFGSKLSFVDIEILNVNGNKVVQYHYENEVEVQITLKEPAGMYLVNIETSKGKQIIRLIKE